MDEEESLKEFLQDYFGDNFEIPSYLKNGKTGKDYVANIKCNIKCQNELDDFIQYYSRETNETLKLKYKKRETEKSMYKVKNTYRCHHDTRYEGTRNAKEVLQKNPFKRFKNTSCPFQMVVKIFKDVTDIFGCNIVLEHRHNHPINSLEALSFKTLSDEVKSEVTLMFANCLTPSQAYSQFLMNMKNKCNDELTFHIQKADRSKCPRRRDFNSLYIKYCLEQFGGRNGPEMFENLEERIDDFLSANKEAKVAYQSFNKDSESAFILVIMTPLMIRVHEKVRQSSELVFVDSTSNLDEHNLRFFLLVTHSVAGALPLGIIITSDEKEETLTKAFQMFKDVLPEKAFYCSQDGPAIFMTDNCEELRKSLHNTWPNATLLLCIFHILQQVWRWLYEKPHGISKEDRVEIMKLFRNLVYASDVEGYERSLENLFDSPKTQKYKNCVKYFEELCEMNKAWARCFRSEYLIRGANTNNHVEAQFLVIKDTILRRQRQYNINMLFDKLMAEFEDHFKRRLLSVADGTFDGVYSQRFKGHNFKKLSDVEYDMEKNIKKIDENLFIVSSRSEKEKTYLVNMSIGCCECFVGKDGSPCWHQFCLWSAGLATCPNFLPHFDKKERQKFSEIAIGVSLESFYYDTVHSIEDDEDNITQLPPTYELGSEKVVSSKEQPHEDLILNTKIRGYTTDEVFQEFENFCASVRTNIRNENEEFNNSLMKFIKRYEKSSETQRVAGLQNFGTIFTGKTRRKIHVQPTAVSRRKSKIGSRQKQSNVKTKNLPNRSVSFKRKHNISDIIDQNVPSAKKAGRSMISNTKYFKSKSNTKRNNSK